MIARMLASLVVLSTLCFDAFAQSPSIAQAGDDVEIAISGELAAELTRLTGKEVRKHLGTVVGEYASQFLVKAEMHSRAGSARQLVTITVVVPKSLQKSVGFTLPNLKPIARPKLAVMYRDYTKRQLTLELSELEHVQLHVWKLESSLVGYKGLAFEFEAVK